MPNETPVQIKRPPLEFREMVSTNSRLRMLVTVCRQVWNLIKLGRYDEAETRVRILAGSLHAWHLEQQKSVVEK